MKKGNFVVDEYMMKIKTISSSLGATGEPIPSKDLIFHGCHRFESVKMLLCAIS